MVEKNYGNPELEQRLKDRNYYITDTDKDFAAEVRKLSGTISHMCFQCGTCTGSCPSAPRSSYRIRVFMRKGILGLKDEVLSDPDLWLCTTCYTCSDRCPRDILPTDVIMAMRNLAFKKGYGVPKNFLQTVQLIYKTGHGVPNNDANRAVRERLGLPRDPPTTHSYPEYIPGIQKILDHYHLKEDADRILSQE